MTSERDHWPTRRGLLLASGLAACAARGVRAQGTYPDRPLRVTVSYGAGGAVDTLARIVMPRLGQRLGQPVVIENRPGAGGTIGAAFVARSTPDGYTLLDDGSGFVINAALMQLPYNIRQDFRPVARVATIPNVILLGPSVQARSLKELLDLARAKPGELDCSSTGVGSSQHLALEMLNRMADVRINHVPYRDAPSSQNDLRSGRIAMTFATATTAIPLNGQDGMRVIAQGGEEPIPRLPGVTAISELVPGFRSEEWQGVFAPAGTPRDIVARLNAELTEALAEETIRERFTALGARSRRETPEEFATFVAAEAERWSALVREARIAL
ncbi:Bug family tripartite tricarboxylate transporter substrate binding protein [Roseomonas populi]|uniref:Tripartite tricarboxylate transporter substrate binding protein n=1 Tax=Roseomonas populi TaxID=3121582 RepID=A0ABT1X369_9PROT|nr:tripartite tricarboxylate transporter substrate binding protein [Roseomonas pecuniae]MCR0982544.1 tripartite tricarboxylate transporter substrate binding protein [Roseomonas pecuniae]